MLVFIILLEEVRLVAIQCSAKGLVLFLALEFELAFPSCTLADHCCSRAGRGDCVPVHSPACWLQVTVNIGLIGSMKEQTAMGKNLAHIHSASLTTIWWLSAQVHCDQLRAKITYFERLLKKKKVYHCNNTYGAHFSAVDTHMIFPCTVLCVCAGSLWYI